MDMDSIPPSYIQATNRDPWTIISSFVRSQDLCSAALVSRFWNSIFTPLLWGNPASHFGTENDAVYVALVRFKRTLAWARLNTRRLTHTLRLPPAHPELYDGPRADWLRDILQRLPGLQSLIVSGLPFFDHPALMNLQFHNDNGWSPTLRLLEANYCLNATSLGLKKALGQFSSLTYVDLSRTLPARDPRVLEALHLLPRLQILKLRALGLRDEDVDLVSRAVGKRVRSLDVRDNRISDIGVRSILQHCVMTANQALHIVKTNMMESGTLPQSMQEYFGFEISEVLRTNHQDRFVFDRLTSGIFPHLGIEDTLGTGITHLYISGNNISVNAVADLLRIQRLHVLDVGTISMAVREKTLFKSTRHGRVGAECLVPLVEKNGEQLTHLRIHHSIVTNTISADTPEIAELEGSLAVPVIRADDESMTGSIQEMPGDAPTIQELSSSNQVFELEGSPVPLLISEPTSSSPEELVISPLERPVTPQSLVSRSSFEQNSSNAQRPVPRPLFHHPPDLHVPSLTDDIVSPLSPAFPTFLSGSSESISRSSPHSLPISGSSPRSLPLRESLHAPETLQVPERLPSRERTYSGLLANHDSKVKLRKSQPHGLLPSMIPHVKTLALTAFPSHSFSKDTAANFISFLTACAEEEQWSQMQSKLGYEFPPGAQKTSADEWLYAKSLFALNRVVIEITNNMTASTGIKPGHRASKSSVEDADCETFWAAASTDYSFFGTAGEEECGVPANETLKTIPLEVREGKMLVDEPEDDTSSINTTTTAGHELLDVLAEVSIFRRQKKAAHQSAVMRGVDPYIHGYWSGDITVVKSG